VRQDQLDALVAFVATAEEKDYSAAGARLGVQPSAVIRSVGALESRLGVALFSRAARSSMRLTEAGKDYLGRVRPAMLALISAAGDLPSIDTDHPSGLLRLCMPPSGYALGLQRVLRRFLDRFPEVNLEVSIEPALVDLVAQGYDAGIRRGDESSGGMVGLNIGPPLAAQVFAAPDYLERRGVPVHPRHLLAHDCLVLSGAGTREPTPWRFARGEEAFDLSVSARLTTNDASALLQAALDGVGIGYMAGEHIDRLIDAGDLVRLLSGWRPALASMTLCYPEDTQPPARLRALIGMMHTGLGTQQA
jgi:DNA-binding transcriptional LysR family regulator